MAQAHGRAEEGEEDGEDMQDNGGDDDLSQDGGSDLQFQSDDELVESQWAVLPVAKGMRHQEPSDGAEYLFKVRQEAALIPEILRAQCSVQVAQVGNGQVEEENYSVSDAEWTEASGEGGYDDQDEDEDDTGSEHLYRGSFRPSKAWQAAVLKKWSLLRTLYHASTPPPLSPAERNLLSLAKAYHWDKLFANLTGTDEREHLVSTSRTISTEANLANSFPKAIVIDGRTVGVDRSERGKQRTSIAPLLKHLPKAQLFSFIAYITKKLETNLSHDSSRHLMSTASPPSTYQTWLLSALLFADGGGQLHAEEVSILRDSGRVFAKHIASFQDGSDTRAECFAWMGAVSIAEIWGQKDLFEM